MNNRQSLQNRAGSGNQLAIVIRASIARLLATRVLSDYYEQVTISKRNLLLPEAESRKAASLGQHIHNLLAKGQDILSEYFPGIFEQLVQDGTLSCSGADLRLYHLGV